MSAGLFYQIATAGVAHDTIDHEVLLIHTGRGTYHSLRGSAAALFPALVQRASADYLAAGLVAAYEVELPEATRAVEAFLAELLAQGLVETATLAPGLAQANPAPAVHAESARAPFEPPAIETFTDLQDLLLADPIHDVSEGGWPAIAPSSPPGEAL